MRFHGRFNVLGTFKVTSQKLRVSDPCYAPDVWCCGTIDAELGTWEAATIMFSNEETGGWGRRVAVLAVRHIGSEYNFDAEVINQTYFGARTQDWTEAPFEVGVDSAQAGFFDDSSYIAHNGGNDGDFYNEACDATSSEMKAGIVGKEKQFADGVVSSSGYGDGGYSCIFHTNKTGLADFAYIVFIDEEG